MSGIGMLADASLRQLAEASQRAAAMALAAAVVLTKGLQR
jgi:hypothetical protein